MYLTPSIIKCEENTDIYSSNRGNKATISHATAYECVPSLPWVRIVTLLALSVGALGSSSDIPNECSQDNLCSLFLESDKSNVFLLHNLGTDYGTTLPMLPQGPKTFYENIL